MTATSWSSRNWKLVSASDNDHIVALFTSQPGLTTMCGTLQVNVYWGLEFEHMLLVTVVLMCEVRGQHLDAGTSRDLTVLYLQEPIREYVMNYRYPFTFRALVKLDVWNWALGRDVQVYVVWRGD